MIPELAPAFAGPLHFARDSLVLEADDRPTISCAELLRPGSIAGLVDGFGARFPGGDAAATLSMWSQFYMTVLVYPVLGARLLLGRDLPVAPEEVSLVLGPCNAPVALRLPHAGRAVAHAPPAMAPRDGGLVRLVRGHVEPMVSALAAAGRVSARVFWCNAAVRFRHALRLLAGEAEAAPLMHRLLGQESWEDGWTNPLARTLHPSATPDCDTPQRRVCCLRYRLPGLEQGCGTCPLPEIRRKHAA